MNTAEEIYSEVSKSLQRDNKSASELWERIRKVLSSRDGGLNMALTTLDNIFEQYYTKCQGIINDLNEE